MNLRINRYSNIILFFLSVIFTLYLIEFYLLKKQDLILERLKIKNVNFFKSDERSILQVYNYLIKKEIITVKYPPKYFLKQQNTTLFPLSGVSSTKTILCNEDGFMSYYISDRYGFNNPDNQWGINNKKKDYDLLAEYVLLGDSFVHGFCVNRPNDIGSVLRNLSKKTVLNLGYVGNGTLLNYATYREYVNFKVKNILFFYYDNDFEDLNNELKNSILINYLSNKDFSQNLKNRQDEINLIINENIIKIFEEEKNQLLHLNKFKEKKNKFYKFVRLDKTKKLLKDNFYYLNYNNKLPFDEFKFIINDLNERIKNSGSNFYFIYLPSVEEYDQSSIILKKSLNYRKKQIFLFLNNQNIKSIDIDKEVFKNHKDPLGLFNSSLMHYNEKGYELISKAIYEKTKNLK